MSSVRIRDQGNTANPVVGIYYRPPNQGKPIDKAFFSYRKHSAHRVLSCWGTSTTLTSAGKVAG